MDDKTWRFHYRGLLGAGTDCYAFMRRLPDGVKIGYVIPVKEFWGVDSPA